MPITLDVAALASGVNLPYAEHGSPEGVPLVMLHGITDSWHSFEPVLPHLPDSIHAYSVTQRGQGDATRTASYTLAELVDDVAQFMDAVGLDRAIVCGHSMGSIVATSFAAEHPERTAGLVIMGGQIAWAALGPLDDLGDELDEPYARGFQESTLARPIPPEFLDLAVSESLKVTAATFRALWDGVVLTDYASGLGRIAAPTLVAWGERDAYCPRSEQDALLATIPGARLAVYEGAGHAFHWEEPQRFAAQLAAFAEEVAA